MNVETEPFGGCDILEPDGDIKSSFASERLIKKEVPVQESAVSSTSNQPVVRIVKKQQMYLEPHGYSKTVTIDEDHGRKTGFSLHSQSPSSSWTGENDDRGSGTRQLSKLTLRIGKKQMTFRVADNPQQSGGGDEQGDWDWSNRLQPTEGTVLYAKNQCAQCNRVFGSMEEIRRHNSECHSYVLRYFPCTYKQCNRSFLTKNAQETHLKDHETMDRPYWCHVCPKRFRHSSNLSQHLKYHVPGSRHFCTSCGRCFRTIEQLDAHHSRCMGVNGEGGMMGRDGKPLRFECDYCGKAFHYRRDKLIHERVHTGLRPYECGYCQKRFTQSQACQIHIRTHTGEKPYVCKSCPKRFTDNSSLRKHEANHYSIAFPLSLKSGGREREESYEEEEDGRSDGGQYQDESRLHLMSQLEMEGEEIEEEVEEEIVEEADAYYM